LNELEEESIPSPLHSEVLPLKKEEINENNNDFDKNLEKEINKHKTIKDAQIMNKEFIIKIPENAKKEDLLVLKKFLLKQET